MYDDGTQPLQDAMQQNDVNSLLIIFAIMACTLPIYYGFKKSPGQGVINSAIVGCVLFLYFNVPMAQNIIFVIFALYILCGIVGGIMKNVF